MSDTWSHILAVILLAPLVAAVLNTLLFRKSGNIAAFISLASAAIGMGLGLHVLLSLPTSPAYTDSWVWFQLKPLSIEMGFLYNPMTAVMLFVVTFVGFWIHVFSVAYMSDDEAKGRYFTGLSIFMFSMLGIVLADNLFMIFVFWELVGFSSYMLIAHYWKTEEAKNACKKAFIMNRVGDLGMLLGIIWAKWHFGTVNLVEIEGMLSANPGLMHAGIALLLVCGFIGKSAQFPLHTWLPDAMAGPTPVSALIHAATMVAAGIYFLGRIFFMLDEGTLEIILWLGTAMAVFAGYLAFAQRDIKKILAYSTLSQLGYMAAAVGMGYPGLALFHTATHAFFKALLFLGSGSVIHACHHEQDIFKMGGLAKRLPVTTATFLVGTLALCGVTFTAGYYSKDAIIELAYIENSQVFALLYLGAIMTAGYMGRLFWIAFMGEPKSEAASHAKESSIWMLAPLVVLAVLAIVGGRVELWHEHMVPVFASSLEHVHHAIKAADASSLFLVLGVVAWVLGLGASYLFYRPGAREDRLEKIAPALYLPAKEKLWFDHLYGWYVSGIQQRVAAVFHFMDLILISGFFMRGIAGIAALLGMFARFLHFGNVQVYAYWFAFGLILFWAFALGYF